MSEWKELQIYNLPPDILTGDYEWQSDINNGDGYTKDFGTSKTIIIAYLNGINVKFRYRKPEPKQPTHVEIMSKWWKSDEDQWVKVVAYKAERKNPYAIYFNSHVWCEWFTGRESADIPPE